MPSCSGEFWFSCLCFHPNTKEKYFKSHHETKDCESIWTWNDNMLQFSPLHFKHTFDSKKELFYPLVKWIYFIFIFYLSPPCNWDSSLLTCPTLHHLVQNEDHVSQRRCQLVYRILLKNGISLLWIPWNSKSSWQDPAQILEWTLTIFH